MASNGHSGLGLAIDYYTGMEAASEAQFKFLRSLRSTSHMFKASVDHRLQDAVWKADRTRQAREFCDDLVPGGVLPAGVAANAGVRRLLQARNYVELSGCMRTFVSDAHTQETILKLLLAHLNEPRTKNQDAATMAGMHPIIAQSLRFHSGNQRIVQDAFKIFEKLQVYRTMSQEARIYVMGTVISVMLTHMTDLALHRIGIRTMLKIMPPDDVDPRFVMVGDYNMPRVLCEIMHNAPNDNVILVEGTMLLDNFIRNVDVEADAFAMATFNVATAEDILVCAMQRFPTQAGIQRHSLATLGHMYMKYGVRFEQQPRIVDQAVKTIVSHAKVPEILENAIYMLCCIEPFLSSLQQTSIDGSVMIPLMVAALCALPLCVQSKNVCVNFLQLLRKLCQRHPNNTQCALHFNTIILLETHYSPSVDIHVDQRWQHNLAMVQLLLTPTMVPPLLHTMD